MCNSPAAARVVSEEPVFVGTVSAEGWAGTLDSADKKICDTPLQLDADTGADAINWLRKDIQPLLGSYA